MGGINHASPNTTQGILNLTESVIDYVEHGYVQFTSNNFGAHIELESTVAASDTLYNYTAPLPTIGLTPFQVSAFRLSKITRLADNTTDPGYRICRTRACASSFRRLQT